MRDKNIKKQPFAQALDDNALENVAGGLGILFSGDPSSGNVNPCLSQHDLEYLQELGYQLAPNCIMPYVNAFIDSNGNPVSPKTIYDILKNR